MPHSLPLSLFILIFATTLSCSSHLYQSNFSILFYLTQCLCLSLSKSMTLVFWRFLSFFFFFCYILLFSFLWNKLSILLPLFLILPPLCHSIFLIFSQCISVSLITFAWLYLWFSCSSTICQSTHSLYITVTLCLYLTLLLYQSRRRSNTI